MASRARTSTSPFRLPLGDWSRILLMGGFLAVLVFVAFFAPSGARSGATTGSGVITPRVETPELDRALLARAKDGTRQERLILEPGPLAHLLEKSLQIVPSVAKALGMPERPVPLAFLRATPDDYRGAYLWYKGELKHLSAGMSGHPVANYGIYEGWIETDSGEHVLFRVSLPPDGIRVGDYVRVEGFFLKLRDSHHLPKTELSPVLVGPQLFPDFRDWDAVDALDPEVLARVRDGRWTADGFVDGGDAAKHLIDSQDVPLWHLASYARHQRDRMSLEDWRRIPALTTTEQFESMKHGAVQRGRRMRVLGSFILGQTYAANPNPLGIEHWTQVWVQVRDLGSKLIPVWIPEKIDDGWHRNAPVELRGYYFRGYEYEVEDFEDRDGRIIRGAKRWTPVFVADQLDPYRTLPPHPIVSIVKWGFLVLVLAIIGLFIGLARRDRRQQASHEEQMVQRRRRRRRGLAPMGSEA